jgi:L-arabinokinase
MDSKEQKPIIYYISAHGYGHGVRSCDIIRALRNEAPQVPVWIVTDLPEDFLRNRLGDDGIQIRRGSFDVGMVQKDSVRVDIPATRDRIMAVYAQREELVRQEAQWLLEQDAGVVVADIPAIPLEAAARIGCPALGVGNFTWNWIYSEFAGDDPGWHQVMDAIAEGYGCADRLLRLPFAEEMSAFRHQEDLPLVAHPGHARREELAAITGADPSRHWVLLSFTSLDWDSAALDEAGRCDDCEFFTVLPLGWERPHFYGVDRERMPFSDVLASVDTVVSKPGFGLVSECIVNRKPLVYVDRTEFMEYGILVEGIERYLRNVHIPQSDLYAGRLRDYLQAITHAPEPSEHLDAGGDVIAAQRILDAVPSLKQLR